MRWVLLSYAIRQYCLCAAGKLSGMRFYFLFLCWFELNVWIHSGRPYWFHPCTCFCVVKPTQPYELINNSKSQNLDNRRLEKWRPSVQWTVRAHLMTGFENYCASLITGRGEWRVTAPARLVLAKTNPAFRYSLWHSGELECPSRDLSYSAKRSLLACQLRTESLRPHEAPWEK